MPTDDPTIPLKRDVLGRVFVPKAQREALLDEFERSGLKGKPFAKLVGVNYQTFASWIQSRRRARGDYARLAVTKSAEADPTVVRNPAPLRLMEAVVAPLCSALPAATVADPATLELMLPGGARVQVSSSSQVALAAQLLHSLRTSC
jgi:hypothetical protein